MLCNSIIVDIFPNVFHCVYFEPIQCFLHHPAALLLTCELTQSKCFFLTLEHLKISLQRMKVSKKFILNNLIGLVLIIQLCLIKLNHGNWDILGYITQRGSNYFAVFFYRLRPVRSISRSKVKRLLNGQFCSYHGPSLGTTKENICISGKLLLTSIFYLCRLFFIFLFVFLSQEWSAHLFNGLPNSLESMRSLTFAKKPFVLIVNFMYSINLYNTL